MGAAPVIGMGQRVGQKVLAPNEPVEYMIGSGLAVTRGFHEPDIRFRIPGAVTDDAIESLEGMFDF